MPGNSKNFVAWNSQPLEEWADNHATGKFIDLNGNLTHYIERGQGEPLILLHGFNMDSATWIRNIDSLASNHRVFSLDLWGEGFSTRRPLDYGYELYNRQITGFMDQLEIDRASLVGHSMGGGASIFFTVNNRARVKKLILVDSVGIPANMPFRAKVFRLPGLAELLLSLPTDLIRRQNLKDVWIYDQKLLTDEVFTEFSRFQKISGTNQSLLSILRNDFFNTLEDEIKSLAKLDIPILITWGQEDKSVPLRSGEEMHRILNGSRFEVFGNAGHMPNFECPDQFNQLVLAFLSDQTK